VKPIQPIARDDADDVGEAPLAAATVIENGFYLAVGYYGLQRFLWEFVKPYGPLIAPFTTGTRAAMARARWIRSTSFWVTRSFVRS
jgi:hypothetical protein